MRRIDVTNWADTLPPPDAPKVWGDGVHDDTAALWWYAERGLPLPEGEHGVYRIVQIEYWGKARVPTERVTSAPFMFLATGEPD